MLKTTRKTLLFTAALAFIGSTCWSAPTSDKFLIVPGQRIGPFRIGVEDKEFDILGQSQSDEAMGKVLTWWSDKDNKLSPMAKYFMVHSVIRPTGGDVYIVETVRVSGSKYKTREGISVRSTLAQIWSAYPNLKWTAENDTDQQGVLDTYSEYNLGVAFQVRRNLGTTMHPCYSIAVFPAGTGPAWMPPLSPAD